MINPNAKHKRHGTVTALSRDRWRGDLNLTVKLDSGHELQELGFIYHKTLKVGDRVVVWVGFRIVSDRYGIESVRRTKVGGAE